MSAHLHEWADLIFGFKQKGEMSKLLSIFFLASTQRVLFLSFRAKIVPGSSIM